MIAEGTLTNPGWYLLAAALFALIPVAVGLLTCYVKISVVLGIIKNALGTQHAPSAMVTLALSLALTMLVMQKVVDQTIAKAKTIDSSVISGSPSLAMLDTLKPLLLPWREFLERNTGPREIAALGNISGQTTNIENSANPNREVSFLLLMPAFLLTELKEGFAMAFIVLLPFLAIDLIISNILMGLGMMMVSPVLISLPIKLILFVVSDSWLLIAQGLLKSYQG